MIHHEAVETQAAEAATKTSAGAPTVVIGAGPGGLTAAYELAKHHLPAVVYEMDDVVGGISRTAVYEGYRFDIGGHRFFSKVPLVEEFWTEILGDDLLTRGRLSRIFYNGRFFDYPLKPVNALFGLGPIESVRIGLSYVKARLLPHKEERNFEQWVSNRFGQRLYEIFFKTYTEKVWGMPCSEISADWAAQRIKNLDLVKAVKNALLGAAGNKEVITTLIDQFRYPRHGPGMMWERCRDDLAGQGIETHCGATVTRLRRDGHRVTAVEVRHADGRGEEVEAAQVLSTMPLGHLVRALDPPAPDEVLAAAGRLRHRDFLTVVLIVDNAELFPDNWIYIHSSDVRVGRVQNFKNWSPEMVPDPAKTAVGLEYFVLEDDDLWSAADEDLIELGTREMAILGLIDPDEVEGGTVVRMPKAYPVYDADYQDAVATVREFVDRIENLQTVGRNGQHRYNNQDHSMLTGIYAARNIAAAHGARAGDDGERYDVWDVNVEQEYHEEVAEGDRATGGDRLVPAAAEGPGLEELVRDAFAPYDAVALGVAVGAVTAAGLALATLVLLLGGEPYGPNLSLLGNYFLGYQVSWGGLAVGTLEAALGGFGLGWAIARVINLLVRGFELSVRRKLQMAEVFDPLVVD